MKHNYLPATRKTTQNSLIAGKFGGEYHKIQCSCGLFGCGRTAVEAMEHLNQLHETKTDKYSTLLFIDLSVVCSRLEEETN